MIKFWVDDSRKVCVPRVIFFWHIYGCGSGSAKILRSFNLTTEIKIFQVQLPNAKRSNRLYWKMCVLYHKVKPTVIRLPPVDKKYCIEIVPSTENSTLPGFFLENSKMMK